jgi:hypothetical protein
MAALDDAARWGTWALWAAWACAALAPCGAVLLVENDALAPALAALAVSSVALLALFFILPFDAIASICVSVGDKRKILYALLPHWHAISWEHSPALWRHRVALTLNAEALSRHAGISSQPIRRITRATTWNLPPFSALSLGKLMRMSPQVTSWRMAPHSFDRTGLTVWALLH